MCGYVKPMGFCSTRVCPANAKEIVTCRAYSRKDGGCATQKAKENARNVGEYAGAQKSEKLLVLGVAWTIRSACITGWDNTFDGKPLP